MKRVRLTAALIILAGAALLPAMGVVVQVATTPDPFRPRDDPVSVVDRRYAVLREVLADERIVGYVPPVPPSDVKPYRAYLVIARYVLAPTHVVYSIKQRLVVVDGLDALRSLPRDFTVRRDFGNGLWLVERNNFSERSGAERSS